MTSEMIKPLMEIGGIGIAFFMFYQIIMKLLDMLSKERKNASGD